MRAPLCVRTLTSGAARRLPAGWSAERRIHRSTRWSTRPANDEVTAENGTEKKKKKNEKKTARVNRRAAFPVFLHRSGSLAFSIDYPFSLLFSTPALRCCSQKNDLFVWSRTNKCTLTSYIYLFEFDKYLF